MKPIILASGSPRRQEILKSLGLEFDVVKSDVEEKIDKYLSNEENVERIALEKALDVVEKTKDKPSIIISADTAVVADDCLLGKPRDEKEAFAMLKSLSGKKHEVVTGVCVFSTFENRGIVSHRNTIVKFSKLDDEIIKNYLKTGEYKDKAGAYAIQGLGSLLVESIEGCYSNVVGLPVSLLREMLAEFDIKLLK